MNVSEILKKDPKYLSDLQQLAEQSLFPSGTSYPLFTRPIIAKRVDGGTSVLVNKESYFIPDPPITFASFLASYLISKIPMKWYETEIQKTSAPMHTLARWISNRTSVNGSLVLNSQFTRLAYDIYTLENHNSLKLDLRRLLNLKEFLGYRYELLVACLFLESAFELNWLKPDGSSIVEFNARHIGTRTMWAVECKKKDRIDVNDMGGSIKRLQNDAYKKNPDYPLFIFVHANLPNDKFLLKSLEQQIEEKLTAKGHPLVLIITNLLDVFEEGWPKVGYTTTHFENYPREVFTLMMRMKNYPCIDHLTYLMGS